MEPNKQQQAAKFKAMARELETETSEAVFETVLKRVGATVLPAKKKAKTKSK